jgi:type I restriction enzyme S subunit
MVRDGYKMTEVGVIPEDWEVVEIGSLGTLDKGRGIRKTEVLETGIPCIRYGELYTAHHEIVKEFKSFISEETASNSRLLKEGEVMFACSGETKEEIGKAVAYCKSDRAYAGSDMIILNPKDSSSEFLGYALNSDIAVDQKSAAGQGDAVVHVSTRNIANLKIPLPPTRTEQSAIATALSDADALLSALDGLVAKKEAFKRGMMEGLLSGERRLDGFSGEWEDVTLDTIAEVKGGKRLPKGNSLQSKPTSQPYIRVTDMNQDGLDLSEMLFVPDKFQKGIENYRIFKDDIYISVAGTLGLVGVIPESVDGANLTENADRLTNIKCDRNFLLYFLKSSKVQAIIKNKMTTGAQPKLAIREIQAFTISLPPTLPEQVAIATLLSDLDAELSALRARREKLGLVKGGMMEVLLSGGVRLV